MTTAMKINLNTSKFRPYEIKDKNIVTYICGAIKILLFHCIMEFKMYVFVPGFLLPIGVMK